MKGRVCLITGASGGIGFETALGLARLGATVIVAARSESRGARAVRVIGRDSGNTDCHLLTADLADQSAVRLLARDVLTRFPRLDVLINNAALVSRTRAVTGDGIELQWAVNHLAPFMLTHLLLPRLLESGSARIINVASKLERDGVIDFTDIDMERGYTAKAAYARSKLANVLFTFELHRRLAASTVTANCLHPGAIATNLLTDLAGRPRILNVLTRRSAPPPALGARTSIMLASDPAVAGVSGAFYSPENDDDAGPYLIEPRPVSPSAAARDEALAARLWRISETQTGLSAAHAGAGSPV